VLVPGKKVVLRVSTFDWPGVGAWNPVLTVLRKARPISGFEASLEFSERGRPERGVMFETSRETKREIRDDVGLYIQVSGIADLRGVDRGRDAAVAVGRRRLRGGDRDQFERRRIEGEGACAHARNAAGRGRCDAYGPAAYEA